MNNSFKYIRRDLKGPNGKRAEDYLLQDKSPITVRFGTQRGSPLYNTQIRCNCVDATLSSSWFASRFNIRSSALTNKIQSVLYEGGICRMHLVEHVLVIASVIRIQTEAVRVGFKGNNMGKGNSGSI
jgi:hypothetical protein